MSDEEKLAPPIHMVFTHCPHCGSSRRDLEEEIKYRKSIGLLPPAYPEEMMDMLPLMDQSKPPSLISADMTTKVPVALIYKDRCADCGTIYSSKFEIVEQKGKLRMMAPPGP